MADPKPQQPAAAAGGEEKKNCPVCKKPIKKAKRYYRNGQYYCNFNCWRAGEKEAAAAAKDASPEEANTEKK